MAELREPTYSSEQHVKHIQAARSEKSTSPAKRRSSASPVSTNTNETGVVEMPRASTSALASTDKGGGEEDARGLRAIQKGQMTDGSELSPESADANAAQPPLPSEPNPSQSHSWQAVWAPQAGAYYFWNTTSGETTWVNPLGESDDAKGSQRDKSSAAIEPQQIAEQSALPVSDEDVALSAGIDPDLAFLDPQLYASQLASARKNHAQAGSATSHAYGAFFDSRTGRMVSSHTTEQDGATRHSSSAKAKRQMDAYFDVDSYEAQRAAERAEATRSGDANSAEQARTSQKLTKKELQYFKDRKAQKRRKQYLSGT